MRWVNTLLDLSYEKVEQLSNGAAYCQIIDAAYPGKVSLSRVNFNADLPNNIQENYKVLQQMFSRCKIPHSFDVADLMRGRFLDNYQFLSWLRQHYESVTGASATPYDAAARRSHFGCRVPASISTPTSNSSSTAPKVRPRVSSSSSSSVSTSPAVSSFVDHNKNPPRVGPPPSTRQRLVSQPPTSSEDWVSAVEYADVKYTLEGVERERDFYYGVLREVEDVCRAEKAAIGERAAGGSGSIGDSAVDRFASRILALLGGEKDKEKEKQEEEKERPLFVSGMNM